MLELIAENWKVAFLLECLLFATLVFQGVDFKLVKILDLEKSRKGVIWLGLIFTAWTVLLVVVSATHETPSTIHLIGGTMLPMALFFAWGMVLLGEVRLDQMRERRSR